jgi:MFS family permease
MAIMGFGGGTMIGAPLADILMRHFATPTSVGVWQTFVALGVIYFITMMAGAFGYRVPPPDWKPAGWTPRAQQTGMITTGNVHVSRAWRTPQFWFLWMVLCMNVSAGIGVIGIASPMIQEIFGGRLLGVPGTLQQLTPEQKVQLASIGAGFAALLSLSNIAGRIGWASFSDYIGRKRTYLVFFALGLVLYAMAPFAGQSGSVTLFVVIFCIILTMYGGGFATIPAYLADIFGTQYVGAIHGRLLTAWSTAGVLGPVLVNYIREYQIDRGVPTAQAYNVTMYVLAGLLIIGLICNLMVKPVEPRHYMTAEELAAARALQAGQRP